MDHASMFDLCAELLATYKKPPEKMIQQLERICNTIPERCREDVYNAVLEDVGAYAVISVKDLIEACNKIGVPYTKWQRRAGQGAEAWDDSPVDRLPELLALGEIQVVWGGNYYKLPPSRGRSRRRVMRESLVVLRGKRGELSALRVKHNADDIVEVRPIDCDENIYESISAETFDAIDAELMRQQSRRDNTRYAYCARFSDFNTNYEVEYRFDALNDLEIIEIRAEWSTQDITHLLSPRVYEMAREAALENYRQNAYAYAHRYEEHL